MEADRLRQKQVNKTAWLGGLYVHDAVSVSLAEAFQNKGQKPKYPSEPYSLVSSEKEQEEQEDREALVAKLYMQNMVLAGRNWGKK